MTSSLAGQKDNFRGGGSSKITWQLIPDVISSEQKKNRPNSNAVNFLHLLRCCQFQSKKKCLWVGQRRCTFFGCRRKAEAFSKYWQRSLQQQQQQQRQAEREQGRHARCGAGRRRRRQTQEEEGEDDIHRSVVRRTDQSLLSMILHKDTEIFHSRFRRVSTSADCLFFVRRTTNLRAGEAVWTKKVPLVQRTRWDGSSAQRHRNTGDLHGQSFTPTFWLIGRNLQCRSTALKFNRSLNQMKSKRCSNPRSLHSHEKCKKTRSTICKSSSKALFVCYENIFCSLHAFASFMRHIARKCECVSLDSWNLGSKTITNHQIR